MKPKPEVIFEDDDIVVINKPPFLRTIPDRYEPELPNLYDYLLEIYGTIYTVHRLDKATSGILVFAKNEDSHRNLSLQFEHRDVQKIYLVLVEGLLQPVEGVIEKAIAPHPRIQGRMVISPKGKPSVTVYKAVENFRHFTLAEADIKTGRTHQIRVHFESIGYPLAVDAVYGRRSEIFFNDIKKGKVSLSAEKELRPLMKRTSLHAWKLHFQHPRTGKSLDLVAELPKDFRALLNQLRNWGKG